MPNTIPSEADLASALKWYAARVLEGRNPEAVAADAVRRARPAELAAWRTRAVVVAAVALVLVVGFTAVQLVGHAGSRPATAKIQGLTYVVAAARSIRLSESDLRVYGELDTFESGLQIQGTTAYAIDGVDPEDALVVRLQPGSRDDAGPLGDYALLVRGSYAPLCKFFDPASEVTPADCR
jgi:hypothetical protein